MRWAEMMRSEKMYLSSDVELTCGSDTGAPEAGRGGAAGGTAPGEVAHPAGSVSGIGYRAEVPLGKLEPRRPSDSRRPAALTA